MLKKFKIVLILSSLTVTIATLPVYGRSPDDFSYQHKTSLWPQPRQDIKQKQVDYSKAQIIVKFKDSSVAKNANLAESYGSHLKKQINKTRVYTLAIPASKDAKTFAAQLKKDPRVEYAEPDYKAYMMAQQTSWGYDSVQAAAAHSTNSANGSGITIAVVDTGVDYTHQDLSNNAWVNMDETAGNNIDDDSNGFIDDVRGWDFIGEIGAPDNDPMDDVGHGTHVAGIAAAEDNSLGMVGVAPSAKIMPVKVLNAEGGTYSDISAGIRYAADKGADVINLSLSGSFPSVTLREAVNYATDQGSVVVAAAGNDFGFNVVSAYPAIYPNVISVGALDEDGKKASYSNWGKVDEMAPGSDIVSLIPDNRYDSYSGTSMAAPFVSGEVALIKQKHPSFGVDQMRQVLDTTSSDTFHVGKDLLTGNGKPNALSATGVLSPSLSLTSSQHRIIANPDLPGDNSATITARIMASDGSPVVGEDVVFSTTKGDINSTPIVTNAQGQASTTLSADNIDGLATVTAQSTNYGNKKIEVVIFNDKTYIQNLGLQKITTGGTIKFLAGENTAFRLNLRTKTLLYFDVYPIHKADISYQVIDENNAIVAGLSGTKNNISVDPIVGAQVQVPLQLPANLANGSYRLQVTAADQDNNKIDSATTRFNVGGSNKILVVPPPLTGSFFTSSNDFYNAEMINFTLSDFPANVTPIYAALEASGQDYDVWPYESPTPTGLEMAKYPLVIMPVAKGTSLENVENYLARGGNLFISSNTDFMSLTLGDSLGVGWCGGATPITFDSTELYASCASLKNYPTMINGMAGSPFAGMSFDIDSYNLSGDGAKNQLVADVLNIKPGATEAFRYSDGPLSAGLNVNNGTYRLIMTGFGLEGVHDNTGGTNTRQQLLEASLGYLKPSSISVSSVVPNVVTKGTASTITVNGSGFERTGITTVKLGTRVLTNINVLSRNKLTARVPSTLTTTGTFAITVINPFGQTAVKANAVTVKYPAPKISSISPRSGSYRSAKTITITGSNFRGGLRVRFNGPIYLRSLKIYSSQKVTAVVPAGLPRTVYDLRLINNDGQSALVKRAYTVTP